MYCVYMYMERLFKEEGYRLSKYNVQCTLSSVMVSDS